MLKNLGVGEYTLFDIIQELEKPGRDPREAVSYTHLDVYKRQIIHWEHPVGWVRPESFLCIHRG